MKKTLLVCMVCLVAMMASSFVNPVVEETVKVTAKAGDTLWGIAEAQYAKGETRYIQEFIEDIKNKNGLTGSKMLQEGQVLTIVIHKRK